ncbi:MAG TPA: hypothetical protein VME22_03220 [Solirubrobacteraceae bacterium]|nr:hypothetical protein [Solirubrobacteraceae bacterium]
MSTSPGIAPVAPRFRIGLRSVLAALGVLVAVGVAVILLSPTGTNRTTVATAAPAAQAATGSPPEIYYLGPRQASAALTPTAASGATGLAGGEPARGRSCLGDAQRCLR